MIAGGLILAAADPMQHVVWHRLFALPNMFGADVNMLDGLIYLREPFLFTNHMLMLLVAAALMLIIFPLIAKDYPLVPRGVRNLFETVMEFIRTEVARPSLHEHTDRFMPFLWTTFFFILFANLLGLVPLDPLGLLAFRTGHFAGTATAGLSITAGLALCAFFVFHFAGVQAVFRNLVSGASGHHHHDDHAAETHHSASSKWSPVTAILASPAIYLWNFAPHVFKPDAHVVGFKRVALWVLDVPVWVFLLGLEFIGALVKPFALAMRLFANMMAGHVVLASLLLLVPVLRSIGDWGIAVPTLLGCAALSCLELFVAFLQAYIFTFLSAMFIGAAVAPEH